MLNGKQIGGKFQFLKLRIRDFMLNDNRVCGDSIALSEATAVVILRE